MAEKDGGVSPMRNQNPKLEASRNSSLKVILRKWHKSYDRKLMSNSGLEISKVA